MVSRRHAPQLHLLRIASGISKHRVAEKAGNSETVIRRRYRRLLRKGDGKEWLRFKAFLRFFCGCKWNWLFGYIAVVSGEMSNILSLNHESLRIRFDGPALADHSMDVSVLGPSLTGLGQLLKAANRQVNGEDVNVRVVMNADVEANCVTMDFQILQGIGETVMQLLGNSHVKTAKEILEWLGLINYAGSSTLAVWGFLKWLAQRRPGEKVTTVDQGDSVEISISGSGNHVTVSRPVYNLALDPSVQDAFLQLLRPLKEPGIESATFVNKKAEVAVSNAEAQLVMDATPADLDPRSEPQTITGHIVIHQPTFDPLSKKWKFKWNGRVESIDISNTDIADTVLKRGGVRVGDAYKVKMEIMEKRMKNGCYKQYFKVIEVLKFVPCPQQGILGVDDEKSDEEDWI